MTTQSIRRISAAILYGGRILHARKGPWHLTVGATISPDPAEPALDGKLADIARTAIARLP